MNMAKRDRRGGLVQSNGDIVMTAIGFLHSNRDDLIEPLGNSFAYRYNSKSLLRVVPKQTNKPQGMGVAA